MSGVSENHWRGKAYKTDLAFVNEIDFFVPCDPAKSHHLFKSLAASAFLPSGWCIGNGAINDPVDAGYAGDKAALDRGFAAASTGRKAEIAPFGSATPLSNQFGRSGRHLTEIEIDLIMHKNRCARSRCFQKGTQTMSLVEVVREKQEALRAQDLAQLLGVSPQQIYKMAAKGEIPSFKVANAVRIDPHETAEWLRGKYPVRPVEFRLPAANRA